MKKIISETIIADAARKTAQQNPPNKHNCKSRIMADCVLWGQFPTTVPYSINLEYGSWETAPWTPGRISFGKGEKMTNSGNCYACQEMWLDVPETDGRYQISNHGHLRQMRRKELLSKIMKMAADIKLQASGSWMPPSSPCKKSPNASLGGCFAVLC